MKKLLVLDRSSVIRESLRILLKDRFQVESNVPHRGALASLDLGAVDLVVVGLGEFPVEEVSLLHYLSSLDPALPIMVMAEKALLEELQVQLKHPLMGLVPKPFNALDLRERIQELLRRGATAVAQAALPVAKTIFDHQERYPHPLLGERTLEMMDRLARFSEPVLVRGERGTGRKLAAKTLHVRGHAPQARFIEVQCKELADEAFGNLVPSSTAGAETLYLEEVGALSASLQAKLMELLDDCGPLSFGNLSVRFRVIASTSENLEEKVLEGVWRDDLFWQLNTLPLYLPPLRDRREEIPLLATWFLKELNRKLGLKVEGLSEEALNALQDFYWPGNVRELESVLKRSLMFCDQPILDRENIVWRPEDVRATPKGTPRTEKVIEKPPLSQDKASHVREKELFSQLVNGFAHEIKNPLVAVKTFAQLLSERFDDEEFRTDFYHIAEKSIDRIEHLIDRILRCSRLKDPLPALLDPFALAMKALAESDNESVRQRVKLEKACDGTLPSVWADGEQVCLAFHNILSYAAAAAPENEGTVVCRIRPLDDRGEAATTVEPLKAPRVAMGMSLPGVGPLAHEMGRAAGLPPSLELFLAQRIIEKNNGSLSFGPTGNAGTLVITLPAAP